MKRKFLLRGALVALVAFAGFAVWKSRHGDPLNAGPPEPQWKFVATLPATNGKPSVPTNR